MCPAGVELAKLRFREGPLALRPLVRSPWIHPLATIGTGVPSLAVYAEVPERAVRVCVDGACGTECYDMHMYLLALACSLLVKVLA